MQRLIVNQKEYRIIPKPKPHVVIPTKKELHGWWPGKRECTSERLLINPYNGCGVGCFFCYALSYPGYFQIFRERGIIFVAKDFHKIISEQLDRISVASCGYPSPITDPFQPLNNKYHLSERIIEAFVQRNIPIEFITKAKVPQEAIETMKIQKHSFVQVSILTVHEKLRKILVPNGTETFHLFENLKRASSAGIFCVCRIDPIFPHITDKERDLQEVIDKAISCGAKYIIASILDIPLKIKDNIFLKLKKHFGNSLARNYNKLYIENIDGGLNAKIDYRKIIFSSLRRICDKKGVTFALCMEYEIKDGLPLGLNQEFSSSINYEGIDIPIYIRKEGKFQPAYDCKGDCLNCREARCGIADLAMGKEGSKKDWRLKDYRRWSKDLAQITLNF